MSGPRRARSFATPRGRAPARLRPPLPSVAPSSDVTERTTRIYGGVPLIVGRTTMRLSIRTPMEDRRVVCRLVVEGRVLRRIVGKRKVTSMTLADAGPVGLNADTILRTIPVLLATAGAIYKFKDARPRRRTNLKADLELLKAAREQRIECDDFQASIETELSRLYRSSNRREWGTIAFGAGLAVLFGIWTVYLVRDGFTWWAVGTGFFTFVGISLATAGLDASGSTESRQVAVRRRVAHASALADANTPQ